MIKDGLHFTMHVSLRYRPYGPNVDIFDIFTGNSEADALNNLKKYIAMCEEKFGHYVSPFVKNVKPLTNEVSEDEDEELIPETEANASHSPKTSNGTQTGQNSGMGRGAHFIGTTWVAHMGTKDKRRIQSSDLEEYLARGYVKAGPRTKI